MRCPWESPGNLRRLPGDPWGIPGRPWEGHEDAWGRLGVHGDPGDGPKDDPWGFLVAFEIVKRQLSLMGFEQLAGLGETLGALSGSLVDSGGSVRFLAFPGRHLETLGALLGRHLVSLKVRVGEFGTSWAILDPQGCFG